MPTPVIDGHNDALLATLPAGPKGGRPFLAETADGHIDLPRARRGGLVGGFFAVFVPPPPDAPMAPPVTNANGYDAPYPPPLDPAYARRFAMRMIAHLLDLERGSGGRLRLVRSAMALHRCLQDNVLGAILHLEGGEPIGADLHELAVLHAAGLRSIGPVWSRPNRFAKGVPFRFPASPDTGPGLTDDGARLVQECNRLRIMIDLAHINEAGFWDVAMLSDAPLVATHTAAHTLCPSTRNLTDAQLDAIGETGGVVGVNFNTRDLRADGQAHPDTPLSEIARHAVYIAERIGVDHVALGSDFDGALVSQHLRDVAGLPRVIRALRDAGFAPRDVEKIAWRNWLRVLADTWGE